MKYVSPDGEWTVKVVRLDGVQWFHVICASLANATVLYDGYRRSGLCRVAGGFLVGEVQTMKEVARFTGLSELGKAA
jgi:hypothetical protein